ncbi:protein piccolo-like [Labrus mixtus]|uniref:protein piccolo-like n=1 Tax=Labrus mixtus TaxID=508554 RepID=UPI0029C01C72|nr:protein piccolo-like [Labrus mixtus]
MFSSKFLSGANPLNAVSSAVNKFGLFGDDGEGDKNQKSPSKQGVPPPGEQQPGAGPGKSPQPQQGPQKSGQGPSMQKSQPPPKQGSPQLHGNGQAGPPNKPAGQQVAQKAGTQPKGPPQNGSPKSGHQQEPSKAPSQQQVPPKTGMQKQGPAKSGAPDPTMAGSQRTGTQQGSPKVGQQQQQQQQGSPRSGQQQQGSPKVAQQQQGSTKPGQQQQGVRTTPQQQYSAKPGPQQQGTKGPGTPGLSRTGSSSQGATKAGSQSKAAAKPLCPVCKTTELNMHTKEPQNHKTCTQCKTDVCSLCGFSPPDSDGREWLCLTCQIQRAQGASEPTGPSIKKPSPNKVSPAQSQPSPAPSVTKEMVTSGSSQKMQSASAKVPSKGEVAKGLESQKQASPASMQKMTPETERKSGSQKPEQTSQTGRKQSSAAPAPQQESGGLFGFGGSKPVAAKPEESVTGKMFGFGSSIFSSASTLITSAVQDEPKTTPPISPKMQSTKETRPTPVQKSVQDKKQEQVTEGKSNTVGQDKVANATKETPKAAAASQNVPKPGQACPICKMVLNKGSKDPPNYNTCTDCKSTVCNQCGFNPMPNVKEGKEWLCLNCQVKRSTGEIKTHQEKSLVDSSIKKPTPAQPVLQKTSAPGSPQRKVSTPAAQVVKAEAAKGPESLKQASPAPVQKTPQESRKTAPQKQPDHPSQTGQKQGNVTAATQQETGGFFGIGSPKSQRDAAKPAESVTGKMFGFGSSIFSSASTMISSAVQDEPKTTPPISPKISAAKDSKSPATQKSDQEIKTEQLHHTKGPLPAQPKVQKPLSDPPKKDSASAAISISGQSTCPLCKLQLNMGSKEPSNYKTCTDCRNTFCNQCGFSPMPNVKEVKEWLCLNCQMQRALGASEPPGTPMMKQQASPNKVTAPAKDVQKETCQLDKSEQKDIPTPSGSKIKETSLPGSPQRKPGTPAEQSVKPEVIKSAESQKQVSPAPGQKTMQEGRVPDPPKQPDKTNPSERKQSNTASTKQEGSVGFFGLSGPKAQTDSAKPSESLGGKMFGFGSSIFSSASTMMNSAVQDDSKKTPPVSPKMPGTKATKSPPAQKQEQEKKQEQVQQPKASPLQQAKVEKAPSEPLKDVAAFPSVSKDGQTTCPLCKVKLNIGSKESPNYNKCTECKNTVCNQCGFNPMPNVSEVKEWLCLNCQMQRALRSSELTAPPMKPHNLASKKNPSTADEKINIPNQKETLKKEQPKLDEPLKMAAPVADMLHKKGNSAPGSPKKTQPSTVSLANKATKGSEADTQESPSQKATSQLDELGIKQRKVAPDAGQETGSQLSIGGPKTKTDGSKTTESVTGKMFGFGSSIFSSASTLISSAVQDESRTTPPSPRKMSAPAHVSRKMSTVPQISPKSTPSVSPKMSPAREPKSPIQKPEQEKKPVESEQSKKDKTLSQPSKAATTTQAHSNTTQDSCPLCKVELNFGSKASPNYNSCTECKTTVCVQCGFNPMPMGEVKEWLCLNCQMKRAVEASEPLGHPTIKSQKSPSKVPSPAAVQLKDNSKPTVTQKTDSPDSAQLKKETSEPVSTQRKQSTASATATLPVKQESPATDHKVPEERTKTGPKKPPDQESIAQRKHSNTTAGTQQDSGGLFGFGGPKTQPDAAKPAESVTGKMFGFGSSIFSSASTLMTSAVDQPKTTPPVSPKMSPAKDMKSHDAQKLEQQKKAEHSLQTSATPPGQVKADKAPSASSKATEASQVPVKPGQSNCPLCKAELNTGSKDLPNYNTCTECKSTVCNQCGFTPMPTREVKEWLCLNCQMKRAVEASEPLGHPTIKSQKSPSKVPSPAAVQLKDNSKPTVTQKTDSPDSAQLKNETSEPVSPQRKQSTASATATLPVKQESPATDHKVPEERTKTGPKKPPDQESIAQRKHSNTTAGTQQDSGGLFGFGGPKTQPDAAKPAESVTGKMFGFGSSIFSSASTLMTSAVDQPKTTPPVSPKMSPAKDMKSHDAQKLEQQKKAEHSLQTSATPPGQIKADKAPSASSKATEASQVPAKPGQSNCPLCKVELNTGSKDLPNYNTCTECKSTVCNQCGFTPMPTREVG